MSEPTVMQSHLQQLPTFARELIAGGMAGGLAKTCVAPLERTKILFQTGRLPVTATVPETLSFLWRTEGVHGLFKGNSASVARIVPYAAIHFSTYEYYRRMLLGSYEGRVNPGWDLLAGSAAGATAVLLTYPMDLVRAQLAWQTEVAASASLSAHPKPHYPTIRSTMSEVFAAGGFLGLFRGITPTLLGILPYAGLKFYVYQSLKHRYREWPGPADQQLSQQSTAQPLQSIAQQHRQQADSDAPVRPVVQLPATSLVGTYDPSSTAQHVTNVSGELSSPSEDPSSPPSCASTSTHLNAQWSVLNQANNKGSFSGYGGSSSSSNSGNVVNGSVVDGSVVSSNGMPNNAGTSSGTGDSLTGSRSSNVGINAISNDTAIPIVPSSTSSNHSISNSNNSGVRVEHAGAGDGPKKGPRSDRLPVPVMLLLGATSGLVGQTVTYPLDVVRRRMQVHGLKQAASESTPTSATPSPASTSTAGARSISHTTHVRSASHTNDAIRVTHSGVDASAGYARHAALPGHAGTTPAATARAPNTWQVCKDIFREAGVRGLYRGLSINYLKVVPSTAIGFTVYDALKEYLDLKNNL